jgi:hypothetical protein
MTEPIVIDAEAIALAVAENGAGVLSGDAGHEIYCRRRDAVGLPSYASVHEVALRILAAKIRANPEIKPADKSPVAEAFFCEHKHKCKWQGYPMSAGLAWGPIPEKGDRWRDAHDERCGGRLVTMLPAPASSNEEVRRG